MNHSNLKNLLQQPIIYLFKIKNKGRQFADDDDDEPVTTRTRTNKRKSTVEEKSRVSPTRKRVKKS